MAPLKEALAACPQDPVLHAEGDVWRHTELVCEALVALPAWRALPADERVEVFAAALLHDVGKPACTRLELDGRISSRSHSRRGAIIARRLLWEAGTPFAVRERIVALVRFHQLPFYALERDDPRRAVFAASQTVRCDHLAMLAEADARGRGCAAEDRQRMLDNAALFAELCAEHGCLRGPRAFPSDHSRFLYFLREGRDPDYAAHEDLRVTATLLSGLPGSGKDHWLRAKRARLPSAADARVAAGSGSRSGRENLAEQPVISLDDWEVPDTTEAHRVEWIIDAERSLY